MQTGLKTKKDSYGKPSLQRLTPGMRSPSIRDALNGNPAREEAITVQEQYNKYADKPANEKFDEGQLRTSWEKYIKTIVNRPNLKDALTPGPVITGENTLELIVYNSVQEEIVKEIKPNLISWLCNDLKNSGIDLIIKVEDRKTERIYYSDSEKYKEMVKKNPSLALLRQKFNLDFEG